MDEETGETAWLAKDGLPSEYFHDLGENQNVRHSREGHTGLPTTALGYCKIAIGLAVVFFAIWGFVDVTKRTCQRMSSSLEGDRHPCWCGTSDNEAIAMGCRYDHLAVDWLPESCIDSELTTEFDASGPNGSWRYFEPLMPTDLAHKSAFVQLDNSKLDQYATEGRTYLATREWHVLHCMFTWRKQFRADFSRGHIEPWNSKEEHIRHCSDYILRAVKYGLDPNAVETYILGSNRHVNE